MSPSSHSHLFEPAVNTSAQPKLTHVPQVVSTNSAAGWQHHQIGMKFCRSFDQLVGAPQKGYNSIPPLAVVFDLCDRRFDTRSGCMTWHLMNK